VEECKKQIKECARQIREQDEYGGYDFPEGRYKACTAVLNILERRGIQEGK